MFASRTNVNTDTLKDKLASIEHRFRKNIERIDSPWPSTTGPQGMAVKVG